MTHHAIDPKKLQKMAHAAVHVGLELKPGQNLVISAPVEALPLVRLVTAEAYKAGANLVNTFYFDDEATLLRYRHAPDASFDRAADWLYEGMAKAFAAGTARLSITGDDPNLLAGEDPAKISRLNKATSMAAKPAMKYVSAFEIPWCVIAYPTEAWAKAVFPHDAPEVAVGKLAEAIFSTSRVTGDDPVADWKAHSAHLRMRTEWLNAKDFHSLRFKAPGTDLTVGLAEGHRWQGGASPVKGGATCNANMPTEEVYTTPHAARVNGVATSTKPLSCRGTLITNIRMAFKDGRVVEASADTGEDVLKTLLATDDSAARLGEVALVPHSSPISQSGLVFLETLFDENAACHIALGQCYTDCFRQGGLTDAEVAARGGNESLIHVDWMIGCGEMDVDGMHADGRTEPVMRGGEWVF